jgi:hypothetical protein
MRLSDAHTDDALRKIGRSIVNFQKLEYGLKELVRLSRIESLQSHAQPVFPRKTKRLKSAGLGAVVKQFNRALYAEPTEPQAWPASSEVRSSTEFRLEVDSNSEAQRRELVALARDRNRLVHLDLATLDFSSEAACVELSRRLDEQNERILRYLEFVRSIRDARTRAVQDLVAFLDSDEFLKVLASDEADAYKARRR